MENWESYVRKVVPYVPGEQPQEERMIKLNTNENPYPPAPGVQRALAGFNPDTLRLYPESTCKVLVDAIASYYGLGSDEVFVGVGSDDVLAMIFLTFFNSGKPVFFPDITYSFYDVWADMLRIPYETKALDDAFEIRVEDYYGENGGVIFPNPNAPTGILMPLDKIEDIIAHNRDVIVVVDEAYIDFTDMPSAVVLQEVCRNVVVLQTLSKAWGLAGLRVGICMADPELVIYLNKVKPPYNIGSLTHRRALDVLRNEADFLEKVEAIKRERKRVIGFLRNLSWLEVVCDSEANFVLIRCERFRELYEYLVEGGVIVRVRHIPPRLSCGLRITIGTREENDLLIERLKKFGDL